MDAHIVKACLHCGKQFTLAYNHQLYCSDECRFWPKVAKRGPDECWLWLGTKPAFGHGQFRLNGRAVYAHRFCWELVHGPLAAGDDVCVLHKCDVPACVNPNHLFVGTRKENLADMRRKKRGSEPPHYKGSRNSFAKITEADVRAIRAEPLTAQALADKYGLGVNNINKIRQRRIWKHVR